MDPGTSVPVSRRLNGGMGISFSEAASMQDVGQDIGLSGGLGGGVPRGHLRELENESIHIIREVAAECRAPVFLYSIGKDSSVLLRLMQKAFHPAPLPFPLLHIDTGWKFKRDVSRTATAWSGELGLT